MLAKGPKPAEKSGSLLTRGFGVVKNLMRSKESKFDEEVTRNSNLIFAELSRYCGLLCNFMVPFERANELLLNLCLKYGMDKSKMHILLTELMSNQRNIGSMFTKKERNYWSLVKRSERLQRFGHSDLTIVLGLTIKFISDDATLRKIVCLNRDLNEILRAETLKQSLLRADMRDIEMKRRDLWVQWLNIDCVKGEQEYKTLCAN